MARCEKKAERANDLKRLLLRQSIQHRFEIAACRDILVSAEADGVLANLLDDVEDRLAALLAHRIAKDPTEQPDIVAQREIFVLGLDCFRFRHGSPFLTDFIDGCLAVIAGTMPYHSSGSRIAFPGSQWPRRRSSPAFLR